MEPNARRAAVDHGNRPVLVLVLGNDDLLHPITVEIDGQRCRLHYVEEAAAAAALELPDDLDLDASAPDRGRRPPDLVGSGIDAQAVLVVDVCETSGVLSPDIRIRRSRGSEGFWHHRRMLAHEGTVANRDPVGVTAEKEAVGLVTLTQQRLFHAGPALVHRVQDGIDLVHDERGLRPLGSDDERIHADLRVEAVRDDDETPIAGEIGKLHGDDAAERERRIRPVGLERPVRDLVDVDLLAIAQHHARDLIGR